MTASEEITADNLREHRRALGFTQVQVAELLGVEKTAVSTIENGNRLLSHAEKLVLECYFFGRVPKLDDVLATH
jgi:transcriptional regulator with XRE-family HTH domain